MIGKPVLGVNRLVPQVRLQIAGRLSTENGMIFIGGAACVQVAGGNSFPTTTAVPSRRSRMSRGETAWKDRLTARR